jgi:hypothetical protein
MKLYKLRRDGKLQELLTSLQHTARNSKGFVIFQLLDDDFFLTSHFQLIIQHYGVSAAEGY